MKESDLRPHQTVGKGLDRAEPIAFSDTKIAYVTSRCAGKRVLDLGCVMHEPSAYFSRYFLHRAIHEVAASTKGMDLYRPGIEALKAFGYDVVEGDAECFAFDETFDVIVAGDLIEHLGNPGGFLKSCVDALAPGGAILIQTPNPWYWRFVTKAILFREVPGNAEHTCWFDPRTLAQPAERHDLLLRDVEYQSRYARDRYMPLPTALKHTSWSATLSRDEK